ncbi:MAG: hypothetical protein ACI4HI_10230 [Lachnospiraceae bacterium]
MNIGLHHFCNPGFLIDHIGTFGVGSLKIIVIVTNGKNKRIKETESS